MNIRRALNRLILPCLLLPALGHADDRLLHALKVLNQRVSVPEETDRAARAAIEVPIGILALTTAMALASRLPAWRGRSFSEPTRYMAVWLGRASTYAVPVGAAFWAGARAVSAFEFWRERDRVPEYDTPRAIRRFLRRPLDEQYIIAKRNPSFADFLINFGESFDVLDRGFTAPVTP